MIISRLAVCFVGGLRAAVLSFVLSGPALADLSSDGFAKQRVVTLVNLGWHAGIAIRHADIDPAALPEIADFDPSTSVWIEFGWGDAEFYQTPEPDLDTILRAAFADTPAVLHLVGVPVEPRRYFTDSRVLDIPLTAAQFRRLIAFISETVERRGRKRIPPINSGLYPVSLFYPATGSFSLSNTCNTWVARAFAAAGLPIASDGVVRASTVERRLREVVERPD